jgi:hypothetical protein
MRPLLNGGTLGGRMTRRARQRILLGPRVNLLWAPLAVATWTLALGVSCWLLVMFHRWFGGRALLAVLAVLVVALPIISFLAHHAFAVAVETDGRELRVFSTGQLRAAERFSLDTIARVELWKLEEPRRGHSPHLRIQFEDGQDRLFSPWATGNVRADVLKLKALLGPLFHE